MYEMKFVFGKQYFRTFGKKCNSHTNPFPNNYYRRRTAAWVYTLNAFEDSRYRPAASHVSRTTHSFVELVSDCYSCCDSDTHGSPITFSVNLNKTSAPKAAGWMGNKPTRLCYRYALWLKDGFICKCIRALE